MRRFSSKFLWSIWGALFGICFPIMAIAIRSVQYGAEKTIDILSTDPLLWIICTAPLFLGIFAFIGGRQNDQVQDFSESLERKVEERTKSLNEANAKLAVQTQNQQSLLAGLSEGIFYFNRSGKIAEERSPALELILPGASRFQAACEFFAHFGGLRVNECESIIGYLWDEMFFSPFEHTAAMLADEIQLEVEDRKRIVRFRYREIRDCDENLEKVIVFVSDITEEREAERQQDAQAERIRRVSMAAADTESFLQFRDDTQSIIASIDDVLKNNRDDEKLLKRQLHTLKGNSATFEFNGLANEIHEIEDRFVGGEDIGKHWHSVKERWDFESKDVEEVLGLSKAGQYTKIDRRKLTTLAEAVVQLGAPELIRHVEALTMYPAVEVMQKYHRYVLTLASRKNKSLEVVFDPKCSDVSYEFIQKISGALTHIVRNCIDHGIEDPQQRQEKGKDRFGHIHFLTENSTQGIRVRIKDDGNGIQTERLVEKAVATGLWSAEKAKSASETEKIELIFAPSLSTAMDITETSGRGVGMDAVKCEIEELGGTVTVFSEAGVGTRFDIWIPTQKTALVAA